MNGMYLVAEKRPSSFLVINTVQIRYLERYARNIFRAEGS